MIFKRDILLALTGLSLLLVAGCGQSEDVIIPDTGEENFFEGVKVGSTETLEVATWNLEHFAKSGDTTVAFVVEAVEAMDADIVALQELSNALQFQDLVAGLEGWTGFKATSDRYINLGFLYREGGSIEVEAVYEILTSDDAFSRTPLVLQGSFAGKPFVVINNHYKCCGDGTIDPDDYWDEEYRRQRACVNLDDFMQTNFAGQRVFVVGDFNDQLTDATERNVFQNFLDQPDLYRFVDMSIAEGPTSGWSFPGYPSHLDHILINAPLFQASDAGEALIQVVPLHTYFSRGLTEYDQNISDHLPVVVRLKP